MSSRIIGTIVGVAGIFFWFMPMVYVNLLGVEAYQAGNHIGGIAYLLFLASVAYAILSWLGQHVPRIIAASVATAIGLLFLVQAGSSAGWGLIGLIGVSIAGIGLAARDARAR